jgi:DNA repair exonuclease SbcCD ATPase subunit
LISEVMTYDQKIKSEELENLNNESKKKLEELERQKKFLKSDCNQSMDDISSNAKDDGICDAGLKNVEIARLAYEKIKQDYELYDYFLSATSKDGISKTIISQNLEVVNSEIKKILSNGVNFEIQLVSAEDGKAIEIFFKHEKSKPRRIELCSGMEKTVAGIAIRAALVNITSLPRSNVFILDEVFTALDPEYMDAVSKMVEYLKTLFDAVILITHIDAFKDLVDHIVEIERDEDGYSRVAG